MSKISKRRNFEPSFKAKVAIEALQEKLTLAELASKHDVFPTQITDWKKELLAGAGGVFENNKAKKADKSENVVALYEQIGRLQMDVSFLKKKL